MFCSVAELGLTLYDMPYAIEDGILILNDDPTLGEYKPGDDIKEILKLTDNVVEFEITPNRPDCLSVIGMARETAASFERTAKYHTPVLSAEDKSDNIRNYLSVTVKNSSLCPRYTARVLKNVKIGSVSALDAYETSRGRSTPDKQYCRYYKLCNARIRSADACV